MELNTKGKPLRIDNKTNYICISDIVQAGDTSSGNILSNYIKNKDAVQFLLEWEKEYNPDVDLDRMNQFRLNVLDNNKHYRVCEYIKETGAIGIFSKDGHYSDTYAHKYIAMHFCIWFNPMIFLYFIKEFVDLKQQNDENWLKSISLII